MTSKLINIIQTISPLHSGVLFACAGMGLFLAQISAVEFTRAYEKLKKEIKAKFGHDTNIFPDHEPASQIP